MTCFRHILRKKSGFFVFFFFFLTFTSQTKAEGHEDESQKSFNFKEMIFSHVTDSYDWHLITIQEHHYSIPLMVIVKSPDRGWFAFSSSRLAHGASYEGFQLSHSEQYKNKVIEIGPNGDEIRPFDISLTKNAVSILLACTLLLLVFLPLAKGYKKDPMRSRKGFAGSLEMLTMSVVNDIIKPCVGPEYRRFTPYLLTAFFFIFVSNLLGLLPFFPGGANVTGNISVTFVLAMFTFFITNVFGNKEYWKEIFWPDVPFWLKIPPIMPIVEILGVFTKPFALMVRLFANMLSGHMIILVLVGMIFTFNILMGTGVATGVSFLSVLFSIFMLMLDVLISFIQAYVFTMLSSIFIGLARAEHHPSH